MLNNQTQNGTTTNKKTYDDTNKGAAWLKKDKNGKDYYNGSVNIEGTEYWISVFTNSFKKNETHPDVTMTLTKKDTK